MRAPELWGGIECTVNRVGDRFMDQTVLTGHQDRIADLDAFAGLGIKAIRYPVIWERIAPDRPDECDWRWTDERLAKLRELGIRPIVGLVHHGAGPRRTNLLDPDFPAKLAEFAEQVARRYPWIEDFTPINELLTTARFSGLYGHWHPHGKDNPTFLRCLMTEVDGVKAAMRAIRRITPNARLVQTDDLGMTHSTPKLRYQADFENERRWLGFDLLTGRVTDGHPLWEFLRRAGVAEDVKAITDDPCPPDLVGINHYLSSERFLDERMDRYPVHTHGGNGLDNYADVEAHRVLVEGAVGPQQLLRAAWERYRLPMAITELHNGCTREEQLRWFMEVWEGGTRLVGEGVDLRAVTAWTLLGAVDWHLLLTTPAGFYEPGVFDVRAPKPRPTIVAIAMERLGHDRPFDHPVLDVPGWWHRHERLFYPPVRNCPFTPTTRHAGRPARPLLIVGSRGTLGQAFARACVARGLAYQMVARPECDLADQESVAAVLRRVKPWAVINAAGYVNVDRAEHEKERCFRENAHGPALLSAECAGLGIQLMTFSTDLVFDGTKNGPYVESDPVNPLSVYGASKVRAEEAVLASLPDALVIRTSAFFGPWDEHNFLFFALNALARGETFKAAEDQIVSPTYVPDLVEHSLDLLIDGEGGRWHLANHGAMSWADLARDAAERGGYPADRVQGVPGSSLGWHAHRPPGSPLVSERGWIMPSLDRALTRFFEARSGLFPETVQPLGCHYPDLHVA